MTAGYRVGAFTPEDVKILVIAYEQALEALDITDRQDPCTLLAAKCIIDLAQRGERDPDRLRDLALKTVRNNRIKYGELIQIKQRPGPRR